jgi:hypothetical protein
VPEYSQQPLHVKGLIAVAARSSVH